MASGLTYVALDGLGLVSYPSHCVDILRPHFLRARLEGALTGFSYAGLDANNQAVHYSARDTDVTVGEAEEHLAPYAPSLLINQSVIYCGLSLGATLTVLGLAAYLRAHQQQMTNNVLYQFVPAVIMVQPGFIFSDDYTEFFKRTKVSLPNIIQEVITDSKSIFDSVERAISDLRSFMIPVYVLFSDNDGFVAYPDDFMNRLETLGARSQDIPFAVRPDPFMAHTYQDT